MRHIFILLLVYLTLTTVAPRKAFCDETTEAVSLQFGRIGVAKFKVTADEVHRVLHFATATGRPYSLIASDFSQLFVQVPEGAVASLGIPDVGPEAVRVGRLTMGGIQCESSRPFFVVKTWPRPREDTIPIAGMLGMDVLRQFVLEVDSDQGRAILRKSVKNELVRGHERILLESDGEIRTLRLRCEGIDFPVILSLDEPFVNTLPLDLIDLLARAGQFTYSYLDIVARPDGKREMRAAGRLRRVAVGSFHVDNVYVTSGPMPSFGLYFFRRFNVVADYPGAAVFVKPSKWLRSVDHTDLYGMELSTKDNKVLVERVAPRSVAARAGIRTGDVFVGLNGRTYRNLDSWAFMDMLMFPSGDEITIDCERDQQVRTAILRTRLENDP